MENPHALKIFIIRVSMALNDKYITGGWIRIVIRLFRNNGGCRDKWQNCIQWTASRPLGEEASVNVDESLSIRELGNGAVHSCPFGSYNECLPSLITARIGNANGPRLWSLQSTYFRIWYQVFIINKCHQFIAYEVSVANDQVDSWLIIYIAIVNKRPYIMVLISG